MNDYNKLSEDYSKTNEKPDKKYSMLPTALKILGSLKDKKIIDVGCGDGFFTKEFSKEAEFVYGIDNSSKQIDKARKNPIANTEYILTDMNEYNYSIVNAIFSPFVLNYLDNEEKLKSIFKKFYEGLTSGGIVVGIIDMPNSLVHDMKKFGSIKRVAKLEEGEKMDVELYNGNEHLVTLHSFYHPRETIEKLLLKVGFIDVTWHEPIISEEGLNSLGSDFWEGYLENCDLAYFSAKK